MPINRCRDRLLLNKISKFSSLKFDQSEAQRFVSKVEGVQVEHSFMSEAVCSYLGLIGLLGEYCPTSKKKNKHLCVCGREVWLYASKAKSEVEVDLGLQLDAPIFPRTRWSAKT